MGKIAIVLILVCVLVSPVAAEVKELEYPAYGIMIWDDSSHSGLIVSVYQTPLEALKVLMSDFEEWGTLGIVEINRHIPVYYHGKKVAVDSETGGMTMYHDWRFTE